MTTTATKRQRSPSAYLRKDARNSIYRAMYGEGDRRSTTPPAFDPFRIHANPDSVDWFATKAAIVKFWREAAFDGRTANKILNDFNHYSKGKVTLTFNELA